MQKLPESPDRKWGDAYAKKRTSCQMKETRSLSAVTDEVTTLKIFLAAGWSPHAYVFRWHAG